MDETLPVRILILQQQDVEEAKQTCIPPLLNPEARGFIWWLCREYHCLTNGVMGQASTLLERYLAKNPIPFFYTPPRILRFRRRGVNHGLSSRIPLLASACISLLKRRMTGMGCEPATLQRLLWRLDVIVTPDIIHAAEQDVFATLNFKLPSYTNVEKAAILSANFGMNTIRVVHAVCLVTEATEFFRRNLQIDINRIAIYCLRQASSKKFFVGKNIKHIHLAAGVLVATHMYLVLDVPDPAPKLSFFMNVDPLYIRCLAAIINNLLESALVGYGIKQSRVPRVDRSCVPRKRMERKRPPKEVTSSDSSSDDGPQYWQPNMEKREKLT